MVLDKRTTAIEGVGYIIAQIIGAIGAAAVDPDHGQPVGGRRRHHQARGRHHRHQRAHPRDDLHRDLPRRHPDRVEAELGPGRGRHPADPGRHPFRDRDRHRLVGQPGPVDRIGGRRRRPERPVDLPHRPDRRRDHRLGHLPATELGARRVGGLIDPRPDRLEVLEEEPAGVAHLRPTPAPGSPPASGGRGSGRDGPTRRAVRRRAAARRPGGARRASGRSGRSDRTSATPSARRASNSAASSAPDRRSIAARLGDRRRIPALESRRRRPAVRGQDPAGSARRTRAARPR